MKKAYVNPEMQVVNVVVETMLAASKEEIIVDPNQGGGATANEKRGWGSLWD